VADDEDLYVRGFYDANGRIIMSIASGSAGFLADTLGQVTETVQFADAAGYDFVNFGYLLGTCSSGCSAQ
ncbi:MAG: hypothetical protein RL120_01045, partial [Gammaproteobacteria bacterium]